MKEKITYESILEDVIALNSFEPTIETSIEALTVIENVDVTNVSNEDLNIAGAKIWALTGYEYNVGNEDFKEFAKNVIKSIKNFFHKVWSTMLKLFKKIKKFILNETGDIDEMIKDTEFKNSQSNESKENNYLDIKLPEFLVDISLEDKLANLSYLYNKLSYIRLQTYGNVRSYIEHIHDVITDKSSDKNFVPFSNEFMKNIMNNYDNDPALSKILSNISDTINNKALGSKGIIGYDKNFYYIFAYKKENDNILNFRYSRDTVHIDTNKFNRVFLLNHLQRIKTIKNELDESENEFDRLNDLFKKILSDVEKSIAEDFSSPTALPKLYYMKQITGVLPKLIKTTELTAVSMFKEYLNLLKQLHANY